MANRTIQIWGQGYGTVDCTATVLFNGNQVYNGTVPTLNTPDVERLPTDQAVIVSFEVPLNLSGTFPVEITFTGTDLYVDQVLANYVKIKNPIYTPEQLAVLMDDTSTSEEKLAVYAAVANPPLTPEQENTILTGTEAEVNPLLQSLGLTAYIMSGADVFMATAPAQAKTNVVINGTPVTIPVSPSFPDPGEWGWEVEPLPGAESGTITFDLTVLPLGI